MSHGGVGQGKRHPAQSVISVDEELVGFRKQLMVGCLTAMRSITRMRHTFATLMRCAWEGDNQHWWLSNWLWRGEEDVRQKSAERNFSTLSGLTTHVENLHSPELQTRGAVDETLQGQGCECN
jgi:hypothetical protein